MGQNCVITIGVNEYYNQRSLKYAVRDAEALRDYCVNEVGFNLMYYFSDSSLPVEAQEGPPLRSEPTYGNIRNFLHRRFQVPFLQAGDNLWFFFAGHGRRENGQDYLMLKDSNPGEVAGTGIAIRYVAEQLRQSGADNVILMLDACRNEDERDSGGIGLEKQKGVITLFSCSPGQISYEIDEVQHGAFTYTLLKALRIQGEGNCATIERLNQHLRYGVPALNQQYGKPNPQTPYLMAEPVTKQHLILIPHQATLADVQALKNDAFEGEAEGKLELAEQLWTRVLAASPADMQAIQAIKRLDRLTSYSSSLPSWPRLPPLSRRVSRRRMIMALGILGGCLEGWWMKQIFGLFPQPTTSLEPPQPTTSLEPPQPTTSLEKRFFEYEVLKLDSKGNKVDSDLKTATSLIQKIVNDAEIELMEIPGGSFVMGSPIDELDRHSREGPQHSVTVPSFLIGRYPITQKQWRAIASLPKVKRTLESTPSLVKDESYPVEQVSWDEAIEACDRLTAYTGRTYRLPSEAEWEYACRAGTTTPFHFGETISPEIANYDGTFPYGDGPIGHEGKAPWPVNKLLYANYFGVSEMHGNVWEWCEDDYHPYSDNSPRDGSPWVEQPRGNSRIARGGSYGFKPRSCRSAYRGSRPPDTSVGYLGFRIAADIA